MCTKADRFQEFLRRLQAAESASSALEAYNLMAGTLNSVEDDLSGVPYDPDNWMSDGRMYPPLADNVSYHREDPEVLRYRSRRHITFIHPDGTIRIEDLDGQIIFEKRGKRSMSTRGGGE